MLIMDQGILSNWILVVSVKLSINKNLVIKKMLLTY